MAAKDYEGTAAAVVSNFQRYYYFNPLSPGQGAAVGHVSEARSGNIILAFSRTPFLPVCLNNINGLYVNKFKKRREEIVLVLYSRFSFHAKRLSKRAIGFSLPVIDFIKVTTGRPPRSESQGWE
ncbi:hypothetical protein ALC62_05833 [Cyphomyrmex costatus]|uniref:Uncharacterized protein n=1 Tax=Cyphomyrmex costatus TaxID=456900 RepID=A0A151IJG1_9HYME|nr:hypothetical protein ALC62_05833 [Cyphomyrmex costatus]